MQCSRHRLPTEELIGVLACLEYRAGDLGGFLDEIAQGFSRVLGVDWSVVTLLERDQRYTVAGDSAAGRTNGEALFNLHGTVTAHVIDSAEPYCVADARMDPESGSMPAGFNAYLGVPLKTAAGEIIGTVCSFVRSVCQFDERDIAVARVFAARAAAAIEQHRSTLALAAYNDQLELAIERRTSELRAAQQQLIQRERLAAIGEFSAKIVHEVRSPLSTMMMALDHLHQLELPQTSKRRLTLAQEEAGRLNRLLGEILSYATPGAGRREWVDVNALVQQTVAAFNDAANGRFGAQRISCRCDIGRPGVTANPDKLRQLLINLLSNACDASPVGTEVTIETREVDAQGMMGICISNHAGDIRLECDLMSEPFYSTKPQGTGLGLAIVKGIVDALQGSFSIVQELTGRVTALVMLPASAEGTDAASIDAGSCHREQSLRGISCVAT